jgi:geranylgeranylglycerol-phosphate geranylgeranyltransferase
MSASLSVPRAYVELSRPVNGVIALAGVGVGAYVGMRGRHIGWTAADAWSTVAVGVATVLILSAGNALNDACDADIDRVNRPNRPIPSGRVSARGAVRFAAALTVLGVALAWSVNAMAVAVAAGAACCLVAYALALKATPLGGNLIVALLTSGAFAAGGIAVGGLRHTVVPIVFVFLFTVSRELVKDIEDVVGDAEHGARTAAVAWGLPRAARLATLFGGVGVVFSPMPFLLGWPGFGWRYVAVVAVGVDAIVGMALWGLWRDPSPQVAARAQRRLKLGSALGLVAVLVG